MHDVHPETRTSLMLPVFYCPPGTRFAGTIHRREKLCRIRIDKITLGDNSPPLRQVVTMRRKNPEPAALPVLSREERLLARARRARRRGQHRRAMMALREAACLSADDARIWTLYAAQCLRAGRRDEAVQALRQAAWLRQRARDAGRARVARLLLEQVSHGAGVDHLNAA